MSQAAEEAHLRLVVSQSGSTADGLELTRDRLLKGEELVAQRSNLQDTATSMAQAFGEAGTIPPPFEPLVLVRLYGVSNSLRQNVDALVHNVHGGGFTFEPVLDLDASETRETVRMAMEMDRERRAEMEAGDKDPEPINPVTDQEVDERIEQLRNQSRRERVRLKAFFDYAVRESSFVRLRRQVGVDAETIGWGAFEVLRNARGEPKRLRYAPAWTLRALPRAREAVEVKDVVRTTDVTWEEITDTKAFRLYVQIYEGRSVYFKEYGDPRTVSSMTGRVYKDPKDMEGAEPNARPATELLWFRLDNPESDVYGLVRWSGTILSVLGSREQEEVNLLFFDNKAIPPLVVMVSGGHLAADAKEELQQLIKDHIKGSRNFHRILILEAEAQAGTAPLSGLPGQQSVRIEIKPLTDAIFKDQIWPEYDRDNRSKVGESFRVPPILRGVSRDQNRSTAGFAWRITEDQVFQPDRDDFDFEINRTLLRDLRVHLWTFKSKSTYRPDPEEVLGKAGELTQAILTPQEARGIVAAALGADLPRVDATWAKLPLRYALAGFETEEAEAEATTPSRPVDTPPQEDTEEPADEADLPVSRVKVSPDTFRRLFPADVPSGDR